MSNIFQGINDAEIFERGKYLEGGFRGRLECVRTLNKETRQSGTGFIVEFKVLESNMPDEHPVGSKCTWFQSLKNKTVAFPSIKEWAAAMAGYASHDVDGIEAEVAPHLADTLMQAVENETDNVFTGCAVRVETTMIKTRNDRDFTRHVWSPAS